MSDRRDRVLLLMLAGLAIYQVASRLAIAQPGPTSQDTYISAVPGSSIRDSVLVGDNANNLSAIDEGNCRVVVLYSPTCGASVIAARQWARARRVEGDSVIPNGWRAIWVNATGGGVPNPIDTMDLPAVRGVAANGDLLAKNLEITAYPVYVILNREGMVTESSVGAPLPSRDDDIKACRLDRRVARK